MKKNVLDFLSIAIQEIYPWLKENGASLNPQIHAEDFLKAVNPKKIHSIDRVFESCDEAKTGREVDACYNSDNRNIVISRQRYPLKGIEVTKIGFVAHEIFRVMGIEGDNYEISQQIVARLQTPKPNCEQKSYVLTSKMGCDYYPGAPIGGCDGFTTTETQSLLYQVRTQAEANYGRENIAYVELGACNYRRQTTMGPFYCDFKVVYKECK